jgi:peroxiredoxin
MPEFEKAHQLSEKNNIKIIGVNLGESKKPVEKFIADHRLSFPILLDGFGNAAEKYRVRSLPVTYLISPDGILREEIFGGGLTKEMIETKINQIKNPGLRPSGL